MGLLEDAIEAGDEEKQAELSSFFKEAQATRRARTGDLPGVTWDANAPQGFTVPNKGAHLPPETQLALDQIYKMEGRAAVDKQMREEQFQRQLQTANIIKQIQGVDPQLQAHILSRMGLDNISSNVPAVESKEQQQARARMAEIKFRHDLEAPDREQKRLDENKLANARLLETMTNNRAMAQYRDELLALRTEQNADKKLDRLKTISGILQGAEFNSAIPIEKRNEAQVRLFQEALDAMNEKHGATDAPPRAPTRDPGNTHPLADMGFNPSLVGPGSTSGGETRPAAPDLSRGVDMGNGVVVRQLNTGRQGAGASGSWGDSQGAPPPRGSMIPPPPAARGGASATWDSPDVVPGDPSGFNWREEWHKQGGPRAYRNERGVLIQPGFENSQTRTKIPLDTYRSQVPRSADTPARAQRGKPERNLYTRHRDRAYEP